MGKNILILPLVFLLAGCATMTVHSPDWDRSVDFSGFKTYAWAPGEQPKTGDPRIDNALTDTRIRSSVDRALALKGYGKTEAENPDFWVSYHLAVKNRAEVMTIPAANYAPVSVSANGTIITNNWGVGFLESQTFVEPYEEGTLWVDILDPRSNKVVWRASVSRVMEDAKSPEARDRRVFDGVSRLLKKFPPRKVPRACPGEL